MGLVNGASGAGPFKLVAAAEHGVSGVKAAFAGSLKQTVPAAWAGRTTDGIPKKIPSRSKTTRGNNSFLFNKD
jgi:hypothetical protein